ncbi:MAG: hypothetical protein KKH98_05125 [Spirochaetes bacterium]|nr:hypothetical protein [Spirochaetota bacterium]
MKKIRIFFLFLITTIAVITVILTGSFPVLAEFKYYEKFDENTAFIHIDMIPKTVEEFISLRDKVAVYPEGGVVMLVLAAKIYVENKEEGMKCFTIVLERNNLQKNHKGYKGWSPDSSFQWKLKYLDQMPWAPNTYFSGTSGDNGYKLPEGPWKFILKTNKYSKRPKSIKFFIETSGADNPRPFSVSKNNKGIWKISGNASSFFTGMKAPKKDVDDDL